MARRKPLTELSRASARPAPRRSRTRRAKEAKQPRRRRRSSREPEERVSPTAPTASTAPRRRRRWLRWSFATVLALASIGVGADWLVHTSIFRVRQVVIVGLRHESRANVLAAAGLLARPMLDVNPTAVARRLAVFPWIRSVVVTKRWPSTVELVVHERTPVAVAFDANHTLQYVDATGHDLGPAPLTANLPTLEYLHPQQRSWPFQHAGFNAALVASRLPPAFAAQVSVITVDASGSVSLKFTTPVTFILGRPTDLTDKFVSVASVIAHTQLHPGDVVDVRVPGELAVSGPSAG